MEFQSCEKGAAPGFLIGGAHSIQVTQLEPKPQLITFNNLCEYHIRVYKPLSSFWGGPRFSPSTPENFLFRHIRYTPQRGEVALLQDGRGAEGIKVELHSQGLSIRSGQRMAPRAAPDPLHIVDASIRHSFVSIGKEMEDSPCSRVVGKSEVGPALNLYRKRDASARSRPRKLLV